SIHSWHLTFLFVLFFFSSRRRHTRSKRDWSSDVCSSDLDPTMTIGKQVAEPLLIHNNVSKKDALQRAEEVLRLVGIPNPKARMKIGRASCRERVEVTDGDVALK